MTVELINTGTELLLGRVLNTHQQWLGRELADLGYVLSRQVTVADSGRAIQEAVREALARADLVITTGGLGPTSDDITRDLIAELFGLPLEEDSKVLKRIEQFFASRKRPMPLSTRVQARVPRGAHVLHNDHGTAPGLALPLAHQPDRPLRASWLIMLPGPPRELRPMFTTQVVPLLKARLPLAEAFSCRTLKTAGLGESVVEEKISPSLVALVDQGLEIGYCARVGEVDIRFVSHRSGGQRVVEAAVETVRLLLHPHVYSDNEDNLETVVVRLLTQLQKKLAVAESCTGGFLAHRLTNIPGASAVLLEGIVTYSNQAKERLLGVQSEALHQHGAVSKAVAREMAEGCRNRSGADYSLAITGIAGPGGGTEDKPVGTVFIALASSEKTIVTSHLNRYDRETFKFITTQQALEILRRSLVS